MQVQRKYGQFDNEADGRQSGHILLVGFQRRDGKFPACHAFGSGRKINCLYTADQLAAEIAKVSPQSISE